MPVSPTSMSPVMVERDSELIALEQLLVQAAGGQCRMVLLEGEAGVGKSRLADEAVRRGQASGFEVLIGKCSERDRDFPFAPFVDALRQRLTSTSEGPAMLLGPQASELAELLPEHPSIVVPGTTASEFSPEQSKRRLFEGIVALLRRLATGKPLLLVLEDLHWSDPTSLELLELLPRRLTTARLFILGTSRAEEPNMELARSTMALHRSRALMVLPLEPLSEAGVGAMLRAKLPAAPPRALVKTVCARTGGNPFLIEESIASVHEPGPWLVSEPVVPATVRDVVRQQLEGLDRVTLRVADLAAVAGERVEFDFLLMVSQLGPDELLAMLHTLIERRILAEDRAPGRSSIVFRHALTRDALLDRLLLPERRSLHRVVAEALEAALVDPPPPDAVGDLGYHFHAAEEWEKALIYAVRAGQAAWVIHASAEAFAHFQRALDAVIALGQAGRAQMHCRCGEALALLGAFDEARRHLEAALLQAERHSDIDIEQESLHALAGLFASRDYLLAQHFAERSLALARSRQDQVWEGRALNRLGNVLTNLTRFAEGRALHEVALLIVKRFHNEWGRADTLDHIGMSRYLSGEVPEARESFGQAAAMFVEAGDLERAASALTSRGFYLAVLDGACATDASPSTCRVDAAEGLRMSQEIDWRAGETYALVALAYIDIGEARYGDALRHAEAALAIAREIDHHQWSTVALLTLGLLHAGLLDDARALQRFEEAFEIACELGSRQWIERLEAWISRCEARLGLPITHGALLPAPLPPDFVPTAISQRRALLTLAEQDLDAGRAEPALFLTERLLLGAAGPRPAEVVLLRANALADLGRREEADVTYQEARRLAEEFGPHSLLWRIAAGRARLWSGVDARLAEAEAATARAGVDAIANSIPDEGWRAVFLGAPAVRPWTAPAGRQRTRRTPAIGGLTDRERDVATCVAQGMSNKEIGGSLSIAAKTVEMHVGACLGKLGFSSRSQLAVWAVAQGLTASPDHRGDTGISP